MIEGLTDIEYHTSDSIFNLTELPKEMLILGCGPIGCELGQGFQRLGTNVCMLEVGEHFLPREDKDSISHLQQQMLEDGIEFKF